MIRTKLRYHRPGTAGEACDLLAEHAGEVAVLGGGTQLLPRMHRGETSVTHVVDLRGLGLDRITVSAGVVEIGAMATYEDVLASAPLRDAAPLLPRVAGGITGGRQLTCQATLVGSACFNNPSSDMPGVFVALGATLRLNGPSGERRVPAHTFFRDAFEVDLRPGEFVASFAFARHATAGYCKVKHSTGSWPIATASALRDDASGTVMVTLGAVEAVPLRFDVTDRGRLDAQVREAISKPWSDVLAPGSYRAAIAAVVARRAITELVGGVR